MIESIIELFASKVSEPPKLLYLVNERNPCLTPVKFNPSEFIPSLLLVEWINLFHAFVLRSSHNALDRTQQSLKAILS